MSPTKQARGNGDKEHKLLLSILSPDEEKNNNPTALIVIFSMVKLGGNSDLV